MITFKQFKNPEEFADFINSIATQQPEEGGPLSDEEINHAFNASLAKKICIYEDLLARSSRGAKSNGSGSQQPGYATEEKLSSCPWGTIPMPASFEP